MIAKSAEFAICRPKLSETFLVPKAVAPSAARELLFERVLLGDRQRLGPDLEARVLPVRGRFTAALDHRPFLADLSGLTTHLLESRSVRACGT